MALAPGGPVAAAAPITFSHTAGSRCVAGAKPATGTITLRLLSPSGATRARTTSPAAAASLNGYEVCFKVIPRPGDRIRAVRGSVQRTITLPPVSIAIDRVTDVVSGRGPKGRMVRMLARHCTLTIDCDDQTGGSVPVNSKGRYRQDLTGAVDLRGMDELIVRYETSAGDLFQARALTPFLQVGTPDRVALYCAPPGTHAVTLRRADGTVRASASFRSPQRCISDHLAPLPRRFRRGGTPIRPSKGNVIRSTFASDARLVWPGPSLQLPGGSVSGTCLRNAPYGVYLVRVGEPGISYTLAEGSTAGDGTFSAVSTMTFAPGDRIRLICVTPAGDHVILDRAPPI
jgi:hypothetical protein